MGITETKNTAADNLCSTKGHSRLLPFTSAKTPSSMLEAPKGLFYDERPL